MKKYIVLFLIPIMSVFLTLCSDSERRMGLIGQTSTVILNIGHAADHAAVNPSIIDRIFRFFTRDAIAQTAPASFSSIKVRVSGADIGLIEKNFTPYGSISLTVPAGNLRQFEVTAFVAPGDPSAAVSFRGTAIANLPAGETVTVPIVMRLNETKIVVPDYQNSRLVILNNINSLSWIVKTYGIMRPYDLDYDSRGRIYVVNDQVNFMMRFDNSNLDNPQQINFSIDSLTNVAIDRKNDIIYFANSGNLYKAKLGSSVALLMTTNPPLTLINGIDVAPDGTLYILGEETGTFVIYHYDPTANSGSGSVIGTPYSEADMLVNPMDIFVQPPYIYVLTGVDPLLRIPIGDYSLTNAVTYGIITYPLTKPGDFYGPRKFLGLRNELIIIDDSGGNNQLISLDYPFFTGWATASSEIGLEFYMPN